MKRIILIFAAGLCLSACATTSTKGVSNALNSETSAPLFEVRASTRKSPNLLAIKDPLIEAIEARANGNYVRAYEKFYAAWLAAPESEAVILGLTDMALRTGHQKTAYQAISKLELNPDTAKPALLAAQVLAEISVGQSPDIETRLTLALKHAPEDSRLWNALGNFYDRQQKWAKAQGSYVQALTTGGSTAGLHNNLGMSYLMQGETKAAISKFDHATRLDPSLELYDNNRRLALALNGDFKAATQALSDRRAADILNDAGYIAKIRHDSEQAKTLFETAIAKSGRYHTKAHENLKRLLSHQGAQL